MGNRGGDGAWTDECAHSIHPLTGGCKKCGMTKEQINPPVPQQLPVDEPPADEPPEE